MAARFRDAEAVESSRRSGEASSFAIQKSLHLPHG